MGECVLAVSFKKLAHPTLPRPSYPHFPALTVIFTVKFVSYDNKCHLSTARRGSTPLHHILQEPTRIRTYTHTRARITYVEIPRRYISLLSSLSAIFQAHLQKGWYKSPSRIIFQRYGRHGEQGVREDSVDLRYILEHTHTHTHTHLLGATVGEGVDGPAG